MQTIHDEAVQAAGVGELAAALVILPDFHVMEYDLWLLQGIFVVHMSWFLSILTLVLPSFVIEKKSIKKTLLLLW